MTERVSGAPNPALAAKHREHAERANVLAHWYGDARVLDAYGQAEREVGRLYAEVARLHERMAELMEDAR